MMENSISKIFGSMDVKITPDFGSYLREISELSTYLENIDYLNSLRSSFLLPSIYMIL